MSLGDPVDQEVTAIARIFDGNLRRNVIDDLMQECIIAVAFLFEFLALRNIFNGGNPSALSQRLVDDQNRATRGLKNAVGSRTIGRSGP